MLYDALVAESRRNDSLDDVRCAALDRVRWLVDLLERQRTQFRRSMGPGYQRAEAEAAATRAEIDGRLAACADEDGRAAVLCLMLAADFGDTLWQYDAEVGRLISRVGGWTPDEVAVMLLRATEYDMGFWFADALGPVLNAADQLDADGRRAVLPWLRYAHTELMDTSVQARGRASLAQRLRALLASVDEAHVPEGLIPAHAPWAAPLRDRAKASPTPELAGLVRHLASLSAPRPAQKWRRTCLELVDAASARDVVADVLRALAEDDPLCSRDSGAHAAWLPGDYHYHYLVHQNDGDLARGVVWAAALTGGPAAVRHLQTLALRTGGRGTGVTDDLKLAGAAINALAETGDTASLEALWRLQSRIGHRALRKQLDTALVTAAAKQGITAQQMIERSVPDHGLAPDGSLERELGGHRVRVAIEEAATVRLIYTRPDGGTSRTPPGSPRGAGTDPAASEDRRPVRARRPFPGRPRRSAHVQDLSGLGQHPDGTGRRLPVHRPLTRHRQRQGLPALRGRPPLPDPQQGVPARSRHEDHRPHHPPPDQEGRLMDLAARLMRALTDRDFILDDGDRHPDLSQASDEELGSLLVAAHRVGDAATRAMTSVRFAVEEAARERRPRYTPDACRHMFEALVEKYEDRGWADLTLGAEALERCTGPLPDISDSAHALVRLWLEKDTVRQPYALLAIAGLAGDGTLRAAVERLTRDVGPIIADEITVIAGLTQAQQAQLSEIDRDHRFVAPLGHASWRRSADNPAYVAFARRALEAAAERTDAIRAGEIPYQADKAFTDREVTVLGQALRVALLRDEPWLPELFERLLPGVAVAPTAAKTLPSQALLYEVVRAAQEYPTPELVTAIRTVRRTVRHAGVPKQLDKMLKKVDIALAERTEVALRLPRLEFETAFVNGSAAGVLRRTAGEYQAVVTVTETATLTWEKEGRPLRGVPAPVRRDHAGLVRELRDLVKRVNDQLTTLVRALEGGFTVDAVHPYGWWRTELAGHPLARTLVRRLIWEIEVTPGTWRAVLPETDEDLPDAPDDASVRLWHPLRSDPQAVRAWRDLLTEQRIRQPFKQAFREIYLLTPAEEQTRVYSNRFAAHLVHYRRMFALFRARGWKSDLLGPWDGGDGDQAERTLAAGEWRARFLHGWADWSGEDELASTDQVRFDRRVADAWRETPLADVPPLIFSEAMRDVDLFVGVTSIAADPDWIDGGPTRAYWERASFAELTESAEARRDALQRILPRLKIADRCALDGRFVVVRGDLRTYRIHLGSANILMEPDDSYLCIVPARGKDGGKVFLPFEDDRLSLILSKAFLLAADTEITDESILMQIKRGA